MSRARPAAPVHKGGATIHERALDNGLRVLVVERHLDPIVAVTLWYRVGSRNEREHEAGLSHFLEHMMFKGAARFGKGEVDRVVTELGGGVNAFTSHDHTGYWFELASDRWEIALDVEADRMVNCVFAPEEFEAEKKVVIEELRMGLDSPWGLLMQELDATARQSLIASIQGVMKGPLDGVTVGSEVRMPFHVNIATATKAA